EQAEEHIRQVMETSKHFDDIALYDSAGVSWASGLGTEWFRRGGSIADRADFQETLSTGASVVGTAVRSRGTGQPAIPYTVPIFDDRGVPRAVLVGDLSLNELSDAIASLGTSVSSRTTLLDMREGGVILTHADPARVLHPISGQNEAALRAVAGERGTLETRSSSGELDLAAYAPVAGLPWSVLILEPGELVFAPIAEIYRRAALSAGIATLFAAVVSVWLTRRLIRPLRDLVDGVRVIGAGHLDHRVGSSAGDEVGILSRAIDGMAADLERTLVARDTLAQSEERFRIAAASASDLIWELDIAGGRLDWYGDVDGALGYEPGGFPRTQAGWEEAVHPDDIDLVRAALRSHLESDTPYVVEYRIRHMDGSYLTWTEHGTAVRDADGRALRVIGACSDITMRKQSQARIARALLEAQRSNRELEQFAYVASHDLQEPLRMISSYTQLLGQRYADQLDDRAREYMAYAVDGAVRMQQLINDLLSYSRIQSQGKKPDPVDSHAALGEAVKNLLMATRESQAIVTNDDLPTVRADSAQLTMVFQNLISNAIKFRGPSLPAVHVSARDLGDEWQFSVKDNGIGIDPRYADRIFVIFQRLHTREEYPGTGIGLAVCRRIVERHDGRIWVESEPGHGATFFFTLPK
ncbi:MAG: sensor histidine kinase, partial [Anaerolineae bacterium]